MIEIKDRRGAVLRRVDAEDLQGANLYGANLNGADLLGADLEGAYLRGANLYGANLNGADLQGADLQGADLQGANLDGADLDGADLEGANLQGADLEGANLEGAYLRAANLRGATMQDGRRWEEYREDHMAGICDDPDVRARAIAAWGLHEWGKCPMSAAHRWFSIIEVPKEIRLRVGAWIALYDGGLLEPSSEVVETP